MTELMSPNITRVDGVYIGVERFGPTVRAFRDGLGWVVTNHDVLPAADSRHLWDVDSDAQVVTMAATPDCPSGTVTLLRFPGLTIPSRGAPSMLSLGYTAISLYALDLDETLDALLRAGGRLAGKRVRYPVPRGDGALAWNEAVRVVIPGDTNLIVATSEEPRPTWTRTHHPSAATSEVNFLIYRSPEWEQTIAWWACLGLTDQIVAPSGGPLGANLFGTAPGFAIRNAVTTNDAPARLELHGHDLGPDASDPGPDLRVQQRPGWSLGLVQWRVVLDSVPESFFSWAASRGATVCRPPERLSSPQFGNRSVGVISGPDGQQLQVEVPPA
jgi:hypothetical protein